MPFGSAPAMNDARRQAAEAIARLWRVEATLLAQQQLTDAERSLLPFAVLDRDGRAWPNSRFDFSSVSSPVWLPRCSAFDLRHRRGCELPSISGVARDLAQAGVARDRRNLVRAAASLSEPSSRRLAQPMRATSVQACGSALVPKPISEASGAIWLPLVCDEKG
jgi:hypothetical protein